MNKRLVSFCALPVFLLLASLLSAFADDAKVGDSVAAIWKDKNYYVATVTAVADGKASLLYEDGDKLDVPLAKVYPFSASTPFAVGDHVMAAWKGAKMFPGVVTAVTDLTCTVKWDDGDKPLDVKRTRIVPFPK